MSNSYFSNSHDFQVQNLTVTNHMAVASRAFEHLHDNIAADAIHNSDERCSIPNCYPETRKAVQGDIHSWITDGAEDAEPKKIMWLTGPAGAGKTAIAGSIAELCEDEGILAGSFFFSSFAGSDTRRTRHYLIATLAYCLLQHDGLQQLRVPILSVIERDPSIFDKSLSAQFKALILRPLYGVQSQLDRSCLPKVIIIDGLDEVEAANSREMVPREARLASEAEQAKVLATLIQAALDPNFPFRILVVSRPEPIIREFLSYRAGHITREVFLDDKYDPNSDIALFLYAKFAEIRRRYKLSASWPGEGAVAKLRDNASGQFIYVSTVVRFLETAGMHPQARLDCVLHADTAETINKGDIFSSLDVLYMKILNSSPDPIMSARWIGAIEFLSGEKACFVRQLLEEYRGQTDYLLGNLASLISIPAIEDVQSSIKFYHKSLTDFFRDSRRCGAQLLSAFEDGGNALLKEHYVEILIAKSPAVPLAESEWSSFLEPFFRGFYRCMRSYSVNASEKLASYWESRMSPCDVLWWVKTVDTMYALREPKAAGSAMAHFFRAIHYECTQAQELKVEECWSLCKRWRGGIISGCRAMGWSVPNAIVLLRERMCDTSWPLDDHDHDSDLDAIIYAFSPPSECADMSSSMSPVIPAADNADDYESILRTAHKLYPRLPVDWRDLYMKGISEGATVNNVLRREILKITRELGIEIEDV